MKRLLFALPLLVALVIGGFAIWGLSGGRDPSALPSVLISQPVPPLEMEPVEGVDRPGLSTDDISKMGGIKLLNVFASWCAPCRVEHPNLTRLAQEEGLTLIGINYKDKPEDARSWLENLGNPYERIGSDLNGRVGIEWGISGVPETFIVAGDGTVLYRYVGPVVGAEAEEKFATALAQAKTRNGVNS